MGLRAPIEKGLFSLCEEAEPELVAQLGREAAAGAIEAVRAIPRVLEALSAIAWDDTTPQSARALFAIVAIYLLRTDDLVPAHEGQELLGLMDDAYLLFRAAGTVSTLLPDLTAHELALWSRSVEVTLTEEVRSSLDGMIDNAVTGVTAAIEQQGL